MIRRTRFNGEYIEEIRWPLRWSLNQIGEAMTKRFGTGKDYIYQLTNCERRGNVTLSTIDAVYNVLVARFNELDLQIPEDLWENLIRYEWVDED
jgi:hypothetical protein